MVDLAVVFILAASAWLTQPVLTRAGPRREARSPDPARLEGRVLVPALGQMRWPVKAVAERDGRLFSH